MAAIHSDEFKRDAVRIALTSGLTRRQVASDLGIGLSTLGKWVRAVSEEAKVTTHDYFCMKPDYAALPSTILVERHNLLCGIGGFGMVARRPNRPTFDRSPVLSVVRSFPRDVGQRSWPPECII